MPVLLPLLIVVLACSPSEVPLGTDGKLELVLDWVGPRVATSDSSAELDVVLSLLLAVLEPRLAASAELAVLVPVSCWSVPVVVDASVVSDSITSLSGSVVSVPSMACVVEMGVARVVVADADDTLALSVVLVTEAMVVVKSSLCCVVAAIVVPFWSAPATGATVVLVPLIARRPISEAPLTPGREPADSPPDLVAPAAKAEGADFVPEWAALCLVPFAGETLLVAADPSAEFK